LFIYTLTDPIDGIIKYIGKTKDLENRLFRHLNESSLKDIHTLKNKWIKDLKNQNLSPVIEILDEGNKDTIDDLERYWIAQFKAWGFKLKNMTEGGDGFDWTGRKHAKKSIQKMKRNHPFRKEINQFDIKTNELINSFVSSHEAEEKTGFLRKHIIGCCKNKKSCFTVGGFYFRFKDDYFPYTPYIPYNIKSVLQYSKEGEFINEFSSLKEAKDFIKAKSKSNIADCCNGKLKTSHGYVWKYKK
jgi:group I intron endonuclease